MVEKVKIGIHGGTSGWTDRCIEVARELGAECYAWLAFTPSGPHRPADALRYPGGTHIVRVANPARYEDPAAWMARIAPALDPWVAAGIPPGALIVQHANEPDVAAVDLPAAWDLGVWSFKAHEYRDALKGRYPNLPLLAPPFSCANTKYLTAEYVAPYEGVAVHCYWASGNPGWRQGTDGGAAWKLAAAFGKPVWVTEVNSNPCSSSEILAWIGEVGDAPSISGTTLFIADGAQSWPAYDVTPEIAAAVRAGLSVAPPPPPPPPVVTGYTRSSDPRGYRPLDARWRPFVAAHNPDEADAICNAYEEGCRAIGYDANCAIAQGCVECAIFTSPRWVNAHAAAGIGIYGDGTPDVIWGHPPHGDARTGVLAQCELLSDYYGDGREPWGILSPHRYGGMTLHKTKLSDMDGVWAADKGYSAAIVGYLDLVMGGAGPPAPPPATGPTLGDLYRVAAAHIGNSRTDEGNPEFGMCEQFVEEVVEEVTGRRVRYPTAAIHGDDLVAAGVLRSGPWKRGAVLVWGRPFDPNGHICFGADYPQVITTYRDSDPATIDTISLIDGSAWERAAGYLGWFVPEGVSEDDAPAQEVDVLVEGHLDPAMIERLWYGAATKTARKRMAWNPDSAIGARWKKELMAGHPLGAVQSGEETDKASGRVVQYFGAAAITYLIATGETFVN